VGTARVARVDHTGGLDEHGMHLPLGERAVLDPAGHDEQLAWLKGYVAVAHLDCQLTVDHQEQFVGVRMTVPGELTLDLDDLDLVVIHSGHHLRRPMVGERGELLGEVNGRIRHESILPRAHEALS